MLKRQIKVDKLDFFQKCIITFEKILLVLGAYEYLERQEGKIKVLILLCENILK